MKWIFLVLLVLFAVGGEVLFIKDSAHRLSAHRVSAAVAFALFSFALFAYWLASYVLKGTRQDRCSEFAHSMLMMSFGMYCVLVGGHIVISDACAFPLPRGGTNVRWMQQLADATRHLQEGGRCAAPGYSFLILGVAFSWPMLKLVALAVRKTRPPPV